MVPAKPGPPMRHLIATALWLLAASASLADDAQIVKDCDYWLLGEDDVEKARRLTACDTIIGDKRFAAKDRAMAYAERASHAQRNDRPKDAIADLSQAIALAPDQLQWRQDRGFLYHFLPDHARALEDFDAYLAVNPSNAHVTFYRGLTYLELGDETRAFADMAKAIELDPNDAFNRYWRGKEYAKRGNIDAALEDLGAAIRLDPSDEDHYILRAELYIRKGETDRAIADLTSATQVKPDYTIPYFNRALIYEQEGKLDLALADYDTLLKIAPGDAYYTNRRAELLKKKPWSLWPWSGTAKQDSGPPVPAPPAKPSGVAPATEPSDAKPPPPAATAAPAAAPLPPAQPQAQKPTKRASAGSGECRRFDAIANMTISVACPE